jgi:hypothetical protein
VDTHRAGAVTIAPDRAASPVRPMAVTRALIFQRGKYYVGATPGPHRAPRRIFRVGNDSPFAVTVAAGRVFWLTESDTVGRVANAIKWARVGANSVHTLTTRVSQASDMVATRHFVYWGDATGIGRAGRSGSQVNPRYLRLAQELGGNVETGMATDGRYLYFSQCTNNRIGRVALTAHGTDVGIDWIVTTRSCPQTLAVGDGYLYWAGSSRSGSALIGRAPLGGGVADGSWVNLRSMPEPVSMVVDGRFLYFLMQIADYHPAEIGRVNLDGFDLTLHYRTAGQGAITVGGP